MGSYGDDIRGATLGQDTVQGLRAQAEKRAFAANQSGAKYDEPNDLIKSTPLGEIARRIHGQMRDVREFTVKLNMHTDAVFGILPEPENIRDGLSFNDDPKGLPALPAIFRALDEMDHAISELAVAAGRNTTLA